MTESEQIRREADDTGPYCKQKRILILSLEIRLIRIFWYINIAELAYWKQRMAKFNNLLEQIKSQRVKAVVGVLQAAKSKSINKWREMVNIYT